MTYNNQQQPFMPTIPKHKKGSTVISNTQQRHCSDLPEVILRTTKKKEDAGKKPPSFSSRSGYRFSGRSPRPDPRFPASCQVVVGPMPAGLDHDLLYLHLRTRAERVPGNGNGNAGNSPIRYQRVSDYDPFGRK